MNIEFLKGCKVLEVRKDNTYLVEYCGTIYTLERSGECTPDCGACCNRLVIPKGSDDNYGEGEHEAWARQFGAEIADYGTIFDTACNQYEDGKCKIWSDGDNFPKICKEFPIPDDPYYWCVIDKCGFEFKIKSQELKLVKTYNLTD